MKRTNIIYWILTGLFAFVMLGSAIPDILVMPMAVQGFKEMGMPPYLLPFLGIAKLLGVIAILIPGSYPRIKEWAYAGLMFDLIGATYSVASVKPVGQWAPMLILIALGACAYAWYHKRLNARSIKTQHQPINTSNNHRYEKTKAANAAIN